MNWGVGDFQFLKSGSDEPCIQPIESSQLGGASGADGFNQCQRHVALARAVTVQVVADKHRGLQQFGHARGAQCFPGNCHRRAVAMRIALAGGLKLVIERDPLNQLGFHFFLPLPSRRVAGAASVRRWEKYSNATDSMQ
ncbi:hypothetical protein FF786_19710 [Bordetella pertussis]